jgi:hypothetical protein
MAKKRMLKTPKKADWVEKFLKTGATPDKKTDPAAHNELIGWIFFDEKIHGLSDPKSKEYREKIHAFFNRR